MTLHGRLFSRLMIDPATGCVLWTGYLTPAGYGLAHSGGRTRLVHRLVYEIFAEPIPADLTLDHLCRVRHCVNVAHLEPVSRGENVLRGNTITATFAAATQCVNGHPFDAANTYWRPAGGRSCRACMSEKDHRYNATHRAERAAHARAYRARLREEAQ